MNKLIQVNIGGIIFQIDEQAYKKLDAYLSSIKRKYASSADGDEIVKDIEARIAEIFTEKFRGTNAAIMENDVDEIISVMGKPEDFESDTSENKSTANQTEGARRHSRFYRDKENNVLGGVCAGFAAKLDIDALWIRLAFLVIFFFAGTGLLLYIILWIIIPEAKTTTEKLEMRGEKVNIDNIEKTVKEGAHQFKTKMNEFGEEVKQTFSKENVNKTTKNAGDFIESFVETIKPFFTALGKIIIFGVLIVCLVIVIAIVVELFTNWGSGFSGIHFWGSHITDGGDQAWILVTCALALIIIPLIGIIFSSTKYLLGVKKKTKYVSRSLGFLWTICLIAVIYLGITIGHGFKYEGSVNSNMRLVQPASQTMYIRLNGQVSDDFDKGRNHMFNHFQLNEDSLIFDQIHIEFEKSPDTSFYILVNKTSRGYDRENAKLNAGNFGFEIVQQNDSVITIPSAISIPEGEPWRGQEVVVIIRVPQNKYVQLNKNIDPYLDNNEFISDLNEMELYNAKLKMTPAGLKSVY